MGGGGFSQECWRGDKSSRGGNQILHARHLARGDRKRCLGQFYEWVVFDRLQARGLLHCISEAPITDKSRLEDKDIRLKRRGGAEGRQSAGNGEGNSFLSALDTQQVKPREQSFLFQLGEREIV